MHVHDCYSFGRYADELRRLIQLYKYDGIRPLAPVLGRYLSLALPRDGHFDVVIPVPLHWYRRLERGFNQSELIARTLCERTGLNLAPHLLRRIRSTTRQARLGLEDRRRNVRKAFAVPRPASVAGRRILLVDDVLTTGATLNACALALRKAGASHVSALTLARADGRLRGPLLPSASAPSGHPHRGATT